MAKIVKALINAKQITQLISLKPKQKKEVKIKVKRKSIGELVTQNFFNEVDTTKVADCSIQSIINSCHTDIRTLFNHNNTTEYKITADCLELKLDTGIRIFIYPCKEINFLQQHLKNGILNKSRHTIHQTRYVIKDNKGKVIVDKKG